MSSKRFTTILPLIVGALGCDGDPNTGPCRVASVTYLDCRSTDPIVLAGDAVGAAVTLEGDLSTCGFVDGGAQSQSLCEAFCPAQFPTCGLSSDGRTLECTAQSGPDGFVGVDCTGRRPAGFEASATLTNFAALAELERASVVAFEILRDELAFHGAPQALVSRAARAMDDERRHTEIMSSLAESKGSERTRTLPARSTQPPRTLFEIALENAVEGCVRETYGAAVGAIAARTSCDAPVRRAFDAVAGDEAEHADLAWDVHEWATPQLAIREREAIASAMLDAVEILRREAPSEMRDAVETLAHQLWSSCDSRR